MRGSRGLLAVAAELDRAHVMREIVSLRDCANEQAEPDAGRGDHDRQSWMRVMRILKIAQIREFLCRIQHRNQPPTQKI